MQAVAAKTEAKAVTELKSIETKYLSQRMSQVSKHFPSALSLDDFLGRVEVALGAHGFRGDNSIAVTNLCRDESTNIFKTEIDHVFGNSFNINGLGACITCGALGALLLPVFAWYLITGDKVSLRTLAVVIPTARHTTQALLC